MFVICRVSTNTNEIIRYCLFLLHYLGKGSGVSWQLDGVGAEVSVVSGVEEGNVGVGVWECNGVGWMGVRGSGGVWVWG